MLKPYRFEMVRSSLPGFREKDHIIPAQSLEDAIRKFARKHQLESPAYWDEPFFDRNIEIAFKHRSGTIVYRIDWK